MTNRDRFFYWALLISLFVHLVLISYFTLKRIKALKKPLNMIEITYDSIKPIPEANKKSVKDLNVTKEKPIKNIKVFSKATDVFSPAEKSINDTSKMKASDLSFESKEGLPVKAFNMERKITVPILKSEKITNPKYLSYNDRIRQKIRQRAYAYVDSPDFQAGQVYLTFALASDGILKQVKIIEDKTSANSYLRTVGIRSIEESGPFDKFPEDLNYPELTFNVVISFEVSDK